MLNIYIQYRHFLHIYCKVHVPRFCTASLDPAFTFVSTEQNVCPTNTKCHQFLPPTLCHQSLSFLSFHSWMAHHKTYLQFVLSLWKGQMLFVSSTFLCLRSIVCFVAFSTAPSSSLYSVQVSLQSSLNFYIQNLQIFPLARMFLVYLREFNNICR